MKLLYFAWVRTNIGKAEEEVVAPGHVKTVEDLLDWIATLGPHCRRPRPPQRDQGRDQPRICEHDHPVRPDDEMAFFPPVTGG